MAKYAEWDNWQDKRATKKIDAAGHKGMVAWGNAVLAWSQDIVPLDETPLMRSGEVTLSRRNDAVYVHYGNGPSGEYAVDQHENLTYKHLPGRTAKYLEIPFNALSGEAKLYIFAALVKALSR